MAFTIQKVEYYHATVEDQPGEGHKVLSLLAQRGVNLLAFTAVPVGERRTQLTLVAENSRLMATEARQAGLALEGPHRALLVQGDDEMGALAGIHAKLYRARVNVYASSGVTDGRGSYGYLIYVRPEDFESAASALQL